MGPSASAREQGKASSIVFRILLLSGSIRTLVLLYMTTNLAETKTNTWKMGIGAGAGAGGRSGSTLQGWGFTPIAALQSWPLKA